MDLTLPIPQTIGYEYGAKSQYQFATKSDGVIVGTIAQIDPTASAYYTYAHDILYASTSQLNEPISSETFWTPVQGNLNQTPPTTAVLPFAPAGIGTPNGEFYVAVREGITGFSFYLSTPGTGDYIIDAYYNSPTGYILLPGATFSVDFMKASGMSTINFTQPTDWQEGYIGTPSTPQKWLKMIVRDGTTVSSQPDMYYAWETSATPTLSTGATTNNPFYNPYNSVLPITGDVLYYSSTYTPYSMIITYTEPLATGNVSYLYSKADGTYGTLLPLNDTSSGFTAFNSATYDDYTLTASNSLASCATVEGMSGDCFVRATLVAAPTLTTNRIRLGVTIDNTAISPVVELQATDTGAGAKYVIWVTGTPYDVPDIVPQTGDIIEILRYNTRLYFMVNGTNIYPTLGVGVLWDGILYGTFEAVSPADSVSKFTFCDWSGRNATPIPLTFTTNTNTTITTFPTSGVFPAHYYIQFDIPTDFASVSAGLSKTGTAGYQLGIYSNTGSPPGVATAWVSPVTLMDSKQMTLDSPDNRYFPTGNQSIASRMNIDFATPTGFTDPATFMILTTTAATPQIRVAYFSPFTAGNIGSTTFNSTGVTGTVIQQISGQTTMTIGSPSFFYLGN